MKITLDKVVAGAEGSLGGRDPGLSGIPAFEGCSLNLSKVKEGVTEVINWNFAVTSSTLYL